jgi:hypothetical protein
MDWIGLMVLVIDLLFVQTTGLWIMIYVCKNRLGGNAMYALPCIAVHFNTNLVHALPLVLVCEEEEVKVFTRIV